MTDLTKKLVGRIEAGRGPRVEYVGKEVNGIGDRSNPVSYNLYCGCGVLLSCLGVLRPNAAGQRSCYCPKCKHATMVGPSGQILGYAPFDITKTPAPRSS
jgi:hypothetical protein